MNQDKEFDQYLKGNSALTQVYAALPDAVLPAHLDAAILAEAHRAVNARPGAKPKRRWTIPLGMVATLFVAMMAGLQLPHMLKDAAAPQQQQGEKMAALMDTHIAGQSSAAPETHKKIQENTRSQPQEKSEIIRAKPAIESSGTVAPDRTSATVVETAPKPVDSESRSSSNVLMAPAAPLAVPSAQAAKPTGIRGLVQDRKNDALEQSAPAAAMMIAPQTEQLKRALKEESSETTLPPDDWLKRIKHLTTEGKLDEAKKELTAFKKRYPEYQVPEAFEIR